MRKTIVMILAALLILLNLAGCTSPSEDSSETARIPVASTVAPEAKTTEAAAQTREQNASETQAAPQTEPTELLTEVTESPETTGEPPVPVTTVETVTLPTEPGVIDEYVVTEGGASIVG